MIQHSSARQFRSTSISSPERVEIARESEPTLMDLQSPKGTVNDQNLPAVVELNVGGQLYTTSLPTLLKDSDSLLSAMFSGRQKIPRDSRGRFFIDRDGVLFRYILDYLRNCKLALPEAFNERDRLLTEAEHFKLKGMVRAIQREGDSVKTGKDKVRTGAFISIGVRGTYAFGRDGVADVKFRKLQRILVCGNVALGREVFGESLNETRDPDRDDQRYTNRFFLKHNYLEKAFDQLSEHGFRLVTSSAGGAGDRSDHMETIPLAIAEIVAIWKPQDLYDR
ncbi:hypothetical protein QZH41_003946 [Actinostola sp. cb2023]|nr:hypothetical protein QZH41_003946 [Actinostola sp. cb2023]